MGASQLSSHLRDFGLIRSTIWQSERFCQLESLDARLAYIWLHTSQKTCAGVLRIGPAHMTDELDFIDDVDQAEAIFEDLARVGLIYRTRPFIVIRQFLKATPCKSYKHAIAALKECFGLPDGQIKTELFEQIREQKGTFTLVTWRDKDDQPHSLVFQINTYLQQLENERLEAQAELNPLDTPYEGYGGGSGKHSPSPLKYKVASITDGGEVSEPPQEPSQAQTPEIAEKDNNVTSLPGPHPETIAAAMRMNQ